MALNFPDSPTLNEVYTDSTSGFSYQWNGTVWISYAAASTGNLRVLDDISGSFNGSQDTFALTSSTIAISPPNPQSVIVNLGGVVQDPSDDYTISGSNIIFSTPPTGGLSFSGVVLGVAVPVGVSTGDAYYRQVYTPVGVQTSFTFINGYGVGYLDVYHNGAKLIPTTDYTATDGINFSLITAAQPGDVVEAIGYRVSSVTIVDGNLNSLTVSGISSLAGQTNITNNLNVTGVTTLGNVVIGSGLTDLVVNGDARVTGILTVGTGSLTLDGSNNSINGLTINAGIVSAVSGVATYYGDGSALDLTGNETAGVSSTSSIFTTGIVTSTVIDGFIPTGEKIISVDTTIANGQENISFAEDLVVGAGVTFTVSTGTTVRMNALDELYATVVSASVELDMPDGTALQRPSVPSTGSIRWNTEYNVLEVYTGTEWKGIRLNISFPTGDVGLFGGGTPTGANTIDYITITSTGNATDFGDLSVARYALAACSSGTRGVFGGGIAGPILNTIDYITIGIGENATDFGDLTQIRMAISACSSSTRGIFGGGGNNSLNTVSNIIDYITIATTGNATDFGDLTQERYGIAACSSSTRGVFGGGEVIFGSYYNVLDYITIASVGNATDFGDLSTVRAYTAACSSSTRGVFGGGFSPTPSPTVFNTIEYITIASTGNATDFGDLTVARNSGSACSNSTRGVFGGGTPTSNVIDYITIATTGNATDFGDLTVARYALAACSNAHGGLS
jgi:hypothetical protein